jgi:DNA processing protein
MKSSLAALLILNACETLDKRILDVLGSKDIDPGVFWEEGPSLWDSLPLTDNVRKKLRSFRKDNWVESELERCEKLNVRPITILDDLYPKQLKETPWAPLVLYVKGHWPLDSSAVGVVGTRRCSSYAGRVSHALGEKLAISGFVPVSGGAKGVDGAVHSGAIDLDSPTVAVLGTGVDRVYPRGHEQLFERICDKGALVTEYPLGTGPAGWRFPKRNRIIAGLSEKVVVVEAPLRSGAMITARYAMEIGRDVWAVPGRIDERVARGTNGLIFDGAYPLIDIDMFLKSFAGGQLALFNTTLSSGKAALKEDDEDPVLSLLREKGERTVDNLASECKMSAAEVLNSLGLLAARGEVYPSGPGRWSASVVK